MSAAKDESRSNALLGAARREIEGLRMQAEQAERFAQQARWRADEKSEQWNSGRAHGLRTAIDQLRSLFAEPNTGDKPPA